MAFVTDMRGLCRAGVTPHTVWYPHTLASPNLVTMELNTAPGEATPSAMMAPRPPVVTKALFKVGLYRSTGPTGSSFFFSFLGGCALVCSRSVCCQQASVWRGLALRLIAGSCPVCNTDAQAAVLQWQVTA